MKRITAFVIVALMCCAVLLPVSAEFGAADIYHSQGGQAPESTTFTYGIDRSYTVSIPEEITLNHSDVGEYATGSAQVGVSDVYLPRAETLQIKLTSTNVFKLKNANSNELGYTIAMSDGGTAIANEAEILSYAGGTDEPFDQSLYFKTTDLPSFTGNYKDTLTFSVKII